MALRNFSSTAAQTTLSAGVTAASTTLTVAATTGFPPPPFILAVNAGASAQELVLVTAVAGANLTVTRGYDSTVASAHDAGAVIQHSHAALDFREANTHVNATSAVHGVAGSLVGTSDTQTLTGKTLALGSNTVSGTKAQFNSALTDADFKTSTDAEFSAWTAWAPTVSAETGALTSVSGAGRYVQIGKTVHWSATLTVTTAGTGVGGLDFTLPVGLPARAANVAIGAGVESALTGHQVWALALSTTSARIRRYDFTTPIASGAVLAVSGTYETA